MEIKFVYGRFSELQETFGFIQKSEMFLLFLFFQMEMKYYFSNNSVSSKYKLTYAHTRTLRAMRIWGHKIQQERIMFVLATLF